MPPRATTRPGAGPPPVGERGDQAEAGGQHRASHDGVGHRRSRRSTWSRPTRKLAGTTPRAASASGPERGRIRARQAASLPGGDAQGEQPDDDDGDDGGQDVVAERGGVGGLDEPLHPVLAGSRPDAERPPLDAAGHVLAEQVEDRRGDVGELDVAVAAGRRRAQDARLDPGRPQGDDARGRAPTPGATGDEHEHGVVVGVDPLEQRTEERVGVAPARRRRGRPRCARCCAGRRPTARLRSDASTRTTRAVVAPTPVEGLEHPVLVEPAAERRGGVVDEQAAADGALGHDAVAAHQRRWPRRARRRRRAAAPR